MDINDILEHITFSDINQDVKSAIDSLINLVEKLSSEIRQLREQNQRLRDENNRLKGEQGKPAIKANTKHKKDISSEKERKNNSAIEPKKKKRTKTKDIKIDRIEKCYIDKTILPADAVFKGYATDIVQDIIIKTDNIEFKREIYYSPSQQKTYTAELPKGYEGEFGPTLKAWTMIFKNICNMSERRILDFFENVGIVISKGKISNILIKDHQQLFHQEKIAIVEAGMETTIYQAIDDTKARVNGQNYHTHILGNPYYTAFFTMPQKNRLTVLNVLNNEQDLTYCLNQHALDVLKQLTLSNKYFQKLEKLASEKIFTQQQFKNLILQHLPFIKQQERVKSKVFEAAAIAAYHKGVDRLVVPALLCDDAPQFKLICEDMALCWIHDGRHYKKLNPVFKYNASKVTEFLKKYWQYYHQLSDYKSAPSVETATALSNEFDQLFSTVTGYNELDDRISKTKMKKQPLLLVLKYPEIPLHNNDMELGARVCARKRDVSLHTITDEGTKANDTLLTIVQTCKKLNINPFQYLLDRITGTYNLSPLSQIIKQKHLETCYA
jgi:regulator of replication initiation timing